MTLKKWKYYFVDFSFSPLLPHTVWPSFSTCVSVFAAFVFQTFLSPLLSSCFDLNPSPSRTMTFPPFLELSLPLPIFPQQFQCVCEAGVPQELCRTRLPNRGLHKTWFYITFLACTHPPDHLTCTYVKRAPLLLCLNTCIHSLATLWTSWDLGLPVETPLMGERIFADWLQLCSCRMPPKLLRQKTIEQQYQKLSQLEHILLRLGHATEMFKEFFFRCWKFSLTGRPDSYVGSVEFQKEWQWALDLELL